METGVRLAKKRSRGRARATLGAGLALALLAPLTPAPARHGHPGGTALEMSSGTGWAATGIHVERGDTIVIDADAAQSVEGPGGVTGVYEAGMPAPRLPHAALIGRIGNGPVFLVGARYRGRARAAGALRLRWNVAPGSPLCDGEYFLVAIDHEPAAIDIVPPDKPEPPKPRPAPSPRPRPDPMPDPVPTPFPDPEPTPVPDPEPEPGPVPVPDPRPIPAPPPPDCVDQADCGTPDRPVYNWRTWLWGVGPWLLIAFSLLLLAASAVLAGSHWRGRRSADDRLRW